MESREHVAPAPWSPLTAPKPILLAAFDEDQKTVFCRRFGLSSAEVLRVRSERDVQCRDTIGSLVLLPGWHYNRAAGSAVQCWIMRGGQVTKLPEGALIGNGRAA